MNYHPDNLQEHDDAQASVDSILDLLSDKMSAEVFSLSDGKEAIVKSANFLYSEFYLKHDNNIYLDQPERGYDELDVGNAIRTVGWFFYFKIYNFLMH